MSPKILPLHQKWGPTISECLMVVYEDNCGLTAGNLIVRAEPAMLGALPQNSSPFLEPSGGEMTEYNPSKRLTYSACHASPYNIDAGDKSSSFHLLFSLEPSFQWFINLQCNIPCSASAICLWGISGKTLSLVLANGEIIGLQADMLCLNFVLCLLVNVSDIEVFGYIASMSRTIWGDRNTAETYESK